MTTYGSLFTGVRGLDLAVEAVFGATPLWHSEIDPGACKVLDAHTPDVPNLGDISTIDWAAVAPVDIICGGFPCQDISSAGKQAGIKEGTRSGLWYRYVDAVRVLRPRLVVVENVRALLVRGLDIVVADLAELGYVGSWGCLPASAVGAPHRRERVFLVAADTRRDQRPTVGLGEADGSDAFGSAGVATRPDPSTAPDPFGVQPERRGERGGLGGPPAGHEGASGQRERVRNTAGDRRPTPADPDHLGREGTVTGTLGYHLRGDQGPAGGLALLPTPAAADSVGSRVESELGGTRPSGAKRSVSLPTALRHGRDGSDWGQYAPAIERWAQVIGRPAPAPTDDRGRLSPLLTEWMMGWPEGHVTGVDITRAQQLKACGNGVVTLQARVAIPALLARLPVLEVAS